MIPNFKFIFFAFKVNGGSCVQQWIQNTLKIKTDLIPVNLLIIKGCFRFLTFGSTQDKYLGYGLLKGHGAWRMSQSVQTNIRTHNKNQALCPMRLAPGLSIC
jgi:hypothetical protein